MLNLALALTLCLSSGVDPQELDPAQYEDLQRIEIQVQTVEELQARGRLSPKVAAQEIERYLAGTATIAGAPFDRAQLKVALAAPDASGLFDFVDIVWIVIGALLFIAALGLAGLYLVPLIRRLPKPVIELLVYLACAAFLIVPRLVLTGGGAVALSLVGCFGLIGALLYTHDLHFKRTNDAWAARLYSGLLWLVWTGAALAYYSRFIGFLASVAFMAMLGAYIIPVLGWVHFPKRRAVPLAMGCAAALIGVFGGVTAVPALAPYSDIFKTGALSSGGAVYFAGCLVLASWSYNKRKLAPYLVGQAVALISGAGMLLVGSLYQLDVVREIGGSFLALYLLEKFFEFPWKKAGWAWMCLALALLLYAGARFVERYPHLFLGLS